ncbi:MAG: hypothetical protein Kow0037_17480 [Calditrichia bacterium]
MPTYRYVCEACGHEFELFRSISSYSREEDCPVCGKSASLAISGGSGLIFKGNGFYITDYKKNGNGNGKKESKSESVKSES